MNVTAALQPAEETSRLGRSGRRLTLAAAPSPAPAASCTRLYAIAFIASVTLCPPNPNEFDRAAVTFTVRA